MNGTPAVLHAPEEAPRVELAGSRRRRVVRFTLSAALVVVLIGVVMPRLLGTTVDEVVAALRLVSIPEGVVLTLLWAGGLWVYSFVLTGALRGLSHRRALTLNLTGSAVSNVLPFGGAVGMSLNYVMIRGWGFAATEFSAFTLVTNLWQVLLKLVLPMAALGALVLSGGPVDHVLRWSALAAAVILALLVAGVVAALAREEVAVVLARRAALLLARLARLLRRGSVDVVRVERVLVEFRAHVVEVIGGRWPQLSVAQLGYGLMQAALLWACLTAVGETLSPTTVLAAYAVDRVASMVVLTPAGAGFAEAGAATVLVALGGSPAAAAAGVLLYRGFIFALEVPVGGAWLGGWALQRRWRTRRAATSGVVGP